MNVKIEEDPPQKKGDKMGDDTVIDTEKVKNKTNKTIFFWSGFHYQITYSLLGGIIPIPQ